VSLSEGKLEGGIPPGLEKNFNSDWPPKIWRLIEVPKTA
jgi:hypothetical protein